MNRGDQREDIFKDDEDPQVHAYCLMCNHFLRVLETPQPNLVFGIKWLLGVSKRFNMKIILNLTKIAAWVMIASGAGAMVTPAEAGQYRFAVKGKQVLLNDTPFKVIGLRVSNALISDETTAQLLSNLGAFKDYGVNTVSVFLMGSRFGDIKGYKPDGSLDPVYASRLAKIIEAADERGMVVLVGCLYWSTSKANEDLKHWTQEDAGKAVANTVAWLSQNRYQNVFVDVDNEGMAHANKKWDDGKLIDAGHVVDPTIMLAYNFGSPPPANADLLIHFSPKDNRRPWIQTEGVPEVGEPGSYWGSYSKLARFYNFIRIGRYTPEMKEVQLRATHATIESNAGYMLASTWLQCVAGDGVGGPFMTPGGRAEDPAVDNAVTKLQKDAGILWWLQDLKKKYGAWMPPRATQAKAPAGRASDEPDLR